MEKKPRSIHEPRQDRMIFVAGREILWSKHWDDPEDYGIDMEREELDGFRVGEEVVAVDDIEDEYGYCVAEAGAHGVVIGITRPHVGGGVFNTPSTPPQICVGWENMDPSSVNSTYLEGA